VGQPRVEKIIEAFENDAYGKLLLSTRDYFFQRFFIETVHRAAVRALPVTSITSRYAAQNARIGRVQARFN